AAAVHACGVEEVDAGVERRIHDVGRAFLVEAHPEVVAAEPGHGDTEVGRADVSEFHQGTCHCSSMCWPKVKRPLAMTSVWTKAWIIVSVYEPGSPGRKTPDTDTRPLSSGSTSSTCSMRSSAASSDSAVG